MKNLPNVVVVTARCSKNKQSYGIRYQEMSPGNWEGTWAFPIKEAAAKREGFDKQQISGTLDFADDYPGCPYCGAISSVKCGCAAVGCWDGESSTYTCPGCGSTGEISGIADSLTAGGDR